MQVVKVLAASPAGDVEFPAVCASLMDMLLAANVVQRRDSDGVLIKRTLGARSTLTGAPVLVLAVLAFQQADLQANWPRTAASPRCSSRSTG